MTPKGCDEIIADVEMYEAEDWEDTTREERYWMQVARDLAVILKEQLSGSSSEKKGS